MTNLKLNETPVRTSRNFNINNIKLSEIEVPEEIKEFNNITVKNTTSKIVVLNEEVDNKLKFGLGNDLSNLPINQNLKVVIDSKVNKEIEIDFNFDKNNSVLTENIEIVVSKDSKATVILKYKSDEENEYFHNGVIKVKLAENANLNIIIANFINAKSNNFLAIENICEENSTSKYSMIEFGGKNNIVNYYSNLIGNYSENLINGIYLGKENQLIDLNYIAELYGEKTNVNIEVQGALKDEAVKHFKGTIDFKKGCKKAIGNENEACMLLSDKAKSLALPMLLCSEEEVEGNHSSSSGKVGDKELFYIMSRGFDYNSAMKLLVRAKFNQILENIPVEALRNEISYEIDRRLD